MDLNSRGFDEVRLFPLRPLREPLRPLRFKNLTQRNPQRAQN
jgi:hypothetical protein